METFSVVIPVYNESECILETIQRIRNVFKDLNSKYKCKMTFVDDGSSDSTAQIINKIIEESTSNDIRLIQLSRNFGHQIALTAGLNNTDGDFIGIIDGDLQDPPECFIPMLEECSLGYDIVYGQRTVREGETIFKKVTASLFYFFLSKLCDISIPRNTGDFRIISKRVLKSLNSMPEKHRFIRGLVPFAGFKSKAYEYRRDSRFAGETKYPLRKMIRFSLDAIFSFSTTPIKVIRYIGVGTLILSLLLSLRILLLKLTTAEVIPGYTSTIIIFLFFTSIQMISISIIGEYVGRIFEESKRRPLYFIDEIIE